ncbi:HPP family protein [Streptomyces chiangmaiensis]|uniref:HPP family protein n=1 Tax=Streptomyces chiangmaiensis TaxID=766497 RepID=A0ABU7FMZ3_9ACTN|nr:HPP family protein [Streptomyces chiangmaiensis]MED7825325.1 HPP family protein [Streptomyces chiangmaiensis]
MAYDVPGMPEAVDAPPRPTKRSPARRWTPDKPWLPPRSVAAAITTSVGLAVLVGVGALMHQAVLVPPLAATMAIVTATPDSPLAQPRHIIGGHMVSCLVCFAVLTLGWHGPWAAVLACGIACGLVLVLRAAHPPAMATAVMIMLTEPRAPRFMALLAAGAVLLVAVQMVSARLRREVYPVFWW